MTLKPTIEADKASGSVLTSSEWNVDSLQSARYLQELVAGTNSDKIPASALATTLALGAITATSFGAVNATTGNFTGNVLAQTNLNVTGTTTLAGMTATSGTFSGALTANAGLTVTGGPVTGTAGTFSGQVQSNGVNVRRMTGGVSGSVTVPSNGSVAFSVTLDDAITPTRATATVFNASAGTVVFDAQITALGSGTVSGIVSCNGAGASVTVHVVAY